MDHLQATHPGLRFELRGYLVRYRHLQPLVVAAVALGELEMALDLLQRVSIHLPANGDEARLLQAFLSPRIAGPDGPR